MAQVQVSYDGAQHCTALSTSNGKLLSLDCPLRRGEEFSPGSLVASGLAGCMLISMATFAERHSLDIAGTRVDVDMSMAGGVDTHIDAIRIDVYVPAVISGPLRQGIESAAEACPIKHSFRPDTEIVTEFNYEEHPGREAS